MLVLCMLVVLSPLSWSHYYCWLLIPAAFALGGGLNIRGSRPLQWLVVAAIAYFVTMLTSSRVTPIERSRVRAFVPLFVANAVFWSLFQQVFTVLAVYSDERMNWSIFGWTAPSNWIAPSTCAPRRPASWRAAGAAS